MSGLWIALLLCVTLLRLGGAGALSASSPLRGSARRQGKVPTAAPRPRMDAARGVQFVAGNLGERVTSRASVELFSQNSAEDGTVAVREKKPIAELTLRWITGLSLGVVCILWVFSSNMAYTLGFMALAQITSMEYYRMVIATGTRPTKKMGLLCSAMCHLLAGMAPGLHELVMPITSSAVMMYLLMMKSKAPTIHEISTSLWGIFYIGYLPSFWIRLKAHPAMGTQLKTLLPGIFEGFPLLQAETWGYGSIATLLTWVGIVASDVGAYFVGRRFGKTKLSSVSRAAGAASPNKSVEGFFGGMAACVATTVFGAKLMLWPYPYLSGTVYGVLIASLGLLGDLTASMMKRDAKVKDSGDVLPGHGGLLDRIDSYMFNAHAAFIWFTYILPLLR